MRRRLPALLRRATPTPPASTACRRISDTLGRRAVAGVALPACSPARLDVVATVARPSSTSVAAGVAALAGAALAALWAWSAEDGVRLEPGSDEVAAFFASSSPPPHLGRTEARMADFARAHAAAGRRVVLLTSGGTKVPLEKNTVRFVDNFSTGTRGAICAERFLDAGYAVIFVHRHGSKRPFRRRWETLAEDLPDRVALAPETAVLGASSESPFASSPSSTSSSTPSSSSSSSSPPSSSSPSPLPSHPSSSTGPHGPHGPHGLAPGEASLRAAESEAWVAVSARLSPDEAEALATAHRVRDEDRLLEVPFETVHEYLFLLRSGARATATIGSRATLVLAAAVSDFYIPESELAEHKIQSRGGASGLDIHLRGVPKVLGHVTRAWAPHAFVVSFKLETDPKLLVHKATQARERYGVHAVVANMLQHRYSRVLVLPRSGPGEELHRPAGEGRVVEDALVARLVELHGNHIEAEAEAEADVSRASLPLPIPPPPPPSSSRPVPPSVGSGAAEGGR